MAIDRVEQSKATHVQYIDFYRLYDVPEYMEEMVVRKKIAGDAAFHAEVIRGYDVVLEVLRTPSPLLRWLKRLFR